MTTLTVGGTMSADLLSYHLNVSQRRLDTVVKQLATGLRVASAQDDPSGYAIAQNLQTAVAGLDQSNENVQTAKNQLNVASGALSTVTALTQRLRTLSIEAASGFLSSTDRAGLIAEANAARAEINAIGANTTFNGVQLFTVPHVYLTPSLVQTVSTAGSPPSYTLSLSTAPTAGNVLVAFESADGYNPAILAPPPGWFMISDTIDPSPAVYTQLAAFYHVVTVGEANLYTFGAASNNGGAIMIAELTNVDPTSPIAAQASQVASGVPLTTPTVNATQANQIPLVGFSYIFSGTPGTPSWTQLSSSQGTFTFGNDLETQIGTVTTGPGPVQGSIGGAPGSFYGIGGSGVGAIVLLQPKGATVTNDFTVQTSTVMGSTVTYSLPLISAQALGLLGVDFSTQASAESSIQLCDNALTTLTSTQATLGAVGLRLDSEAERNALASVNLTASLSTIRDLNVANAVSQEQLVSMLADLGTKMLTQVNGQSQLVLQLFR